MNTNNTRSYLKGYETDLYDATVTYTKPDGTRATKTWTRESEAEVLEKVKTVFTKAQADHPSHDFNPEISVSSRRLVVEPLKPLSWKAIASARGEAAYRDRIRRNSF